MFVIASVQCFTYVSSIVKWLSGGSLIEFAQPPCRYTCYKIQPLQKLYIFCMSVTTQTSTPTPIPTCARLLPLSIVGPAETPE
jgi:hypothetical protein